MIRLDGLAIMLAAAAAATAVRSSGRLTMVRRGMARPPPVQLERQVQACLAALRGLVARRSQSDRRRAATIELARALAAELRAGATAGQAVGRATAAVPGLCDEAARAAALGGDVPAALAACASRAGCGGLTWVAAIWAVGHGTGAGLAGGFDRTADWLERDQALRREMSAQLAAPRSTARLLAGLPLLGLGLGGAIGAQPLDVLLGTSYGRLALAAGVSLAALGLWWTGRLASAVERRL